MTFRQIDWVRSKQMCPGWIKIALTKSLSQQLRQLCLPAPLEHMHVCKHANSVTHIHTCVKGSVHRLLAAILHVQVWHVVGWTGISAPTEAAKPCAQMKRHEVTCESDWRRAVRPIWPSVEKKKEKKMYSSIPWINWELHKKIVVGLFAGGKRILLTAVKGGNLRTKREVTTPPPPHPPEGGRVRKKSSIVLCLS